MAHIHSRVHPRWRSYDYMRSGYYFVTTITHGRQPILGALTRKGVSLTTSGRIVHRCWLTVAATFDGIRIDRFVVMPDHVHAIVVLLQTHARTASLSQVVGWTKQRASREINAHVPGPAPRWQRSFHDSIIRDADALMRIRRYIAANPARAWDAMRADR